MKKSTKACGRPWTSIATDNDLRSCCSCRCTALMLASWASCSMLWNLSLNVRLLAGDREPEGPLPGLRAPGFMLTVGQAALLCDRWGRATVKRWSQHQPCQQYAQALKGHSIATLESMLPKSTRTNEQVVVAASGCGPATGRKFVLIARL
eukprot:GHUV01046392.1.p1 GENE.GHUV01046392.1~~GHUV01046392.1.p1  ORF type:complete len:150 (+),score=8.59 GHUV01046392.1:82-531(+)